MESETHSYVEVQQVAVSLLDSGCAAPRSVRDIPSSQIRESGTWTVEVLTIGLRIIYGTRRMSGKQQFEECWSTEMLAPDVCGK
jgi:hypothetical protein